MLAVNQSQIIVQGAPVQGFGANFLENLVIDSTSMISVKGAGSLKNNSRLNFSGDLKVRFVGVIYKGDVDVNDNNNLEFVGKLFDDLDIIEHDKAFETKLLDKLLSRNQGQITIKGAHFTIKNEVITSRIFDQWTDRRHKNVMGRFTGSVEVFAQDFTGQYESSPEIDQNKIQTKSLSTNLTDSEKRVWLDKQSGLYDEMLNCPKKKKSWFS